MKNVMARAWEIYRTLEGDRLAKLSLALRQAWSEIKGGNKMVELKGSEKQIKWATDLREKMNKECDTWVKAIKAADYSKEETREKAINQIESVRNHVNNIESSGEIISKLKEFFHELYRVDKMKNLVKEINGSSSITRADKLFWEMI